MHSCAALTAPQVTPCSDIMNTSPLSRVDLSGIERRCAIKSRGQRHVEPFQQPTKTDTKESYRGTGRWRRNG